MNNPSYSADGKFDFGGKRITPGLAYLLKVQADFRERGMKDGSDFSSFDEDMAGCEEVSISECLTMALFSPKLMIAAAVCCFFLPVLKLNSGKVPEDFLTASQAASGALCSVTPTAHGTAAGSTASVHPRPVLQWLGER